MEAHTPNPGSDPDPDDPGRDVPEPPVPPDAEPVVPQRDPPKPNDPPGGPAPIIA